MKLSEKIYELRKKSGMSQEEFAEKLDVSRQAVSRWEVGSAIPDAVNVLQISRLFGVSTDYILNDEYESDQDIPAVKINKEAGKMIIKRGAAFCVMTFGLFMNGVIYILSRFIPVQIPKIYYENGVKMWEWGKLTGRSYRYFIENFDLELIAILGWVLVIAALIYLILSAKRIRSAATGLLAKLKRRA